MLDVVPCSDLVTLLWSMITPTVHTSDLNGSSHLNYGTVLASPDRVIGAEQHWATSEMVQVAFLSFWRKYLAVQFPEHAKTYKELFAKTEGVARNTYRGFVGKLQLDSRSQVFFYLKGGNNSYQFALFFISLDLPLFRQVDHVVFGN